MPFRIRQHDLFSSFITVLDPIDLGNYGFKKFPPTDKPTVPIEKSMITKLCTLAFPRPAITTTWYYKKGQIMKTSQASSTRMPNFDPEFYPNPFGHSLLKEEFLDPEVFNSGETSFCFPIQNTTQNFKIDRNKSNRNENF